jgi:hypothetical protein
MISFKRVGCAWRGWEVAGEWLSMMIEGIEERRAFDIVGVGDSSMITRSTDHLDTYLICWEEC